MNVRRLAIFGIIIVPAIALAASLFYVVNMLLLHNAPAGSVSQQKARPTAPLVTASATSGWQVFPVPEDLLQQLGPLPGSPPPSSIPLPDRLVVTRPEDDFDHLPALTKTITDVPTVRTLYRDIYALPAITYTADDIHCPGGGFISYDLNFFSAGAPELYAHYEPTGCASVQLNGGPSRWASPFYAFFGDLEQALVLSDKQFIGDQ